MESDSVPALGLGTWQIDGSDATRAVEHALSLGYRHIDTAQAYGNEEDVGRGLDRSSVPRRDVFLTTKIWWENLEPGNLIASAEKSLQRLGTSYVDLLLIHWPSQSVPLEASLRAMTRLQDQGKARHLGVSNFTPPLLLDALDEAPVVCDQVELHPYLAQGELLELAAEHGFVLTAYCPLARGRVLGDETLREIGRRHGKTPAQVALRWLLDHGPVAAIPKAADPGHREENLAIFDFELTPDERDAVDTLDEGLRLIDPEFAPDWNDDRRRSA